jgi:hypothetical protein
MTSERVLHCQRRRIQPGFRDFFVVPCPSGEHRLAMERQNPIPIGAPIQSGSEML